MPNITNIPAPRVEFIDPRTGLMSREWYRFFLNLFTLTGGGSSSTSLPDLLVSPLPQADGIDEIYKDLDGLASAPTNNAVLSRIAQIEKELDGLKTQVQPQLGTMAALQQANLPWVTFDTTPETVPTATTGTVYWNSDDNAKSLNLVMEDTGGVVQQIGEKTYYRVKADSNITKGQAVMFTGTLGASGGLKAAPATGLTAIQNEYIMGIAAQDIATNGWGYIAWFGEVRGIDTTGGAEAWVDGQVLYYNPAVAGGLTKNVPTAPNPKVIMAAVVNAAANGVLFVRPTFGSALGATDSNVQITSLANGDLLQYVSANNRWENIPVSSVVISAGGAPVTKTADFAVAAGETWLINNKAGSTCTVTLPTASASTGRILTFQNYQAQLLVSASSNVVPLGGGSAGTAILAAVVGNWATMVSDGTNWVVMQDAPNNALLIE